MACGLPKSLQPFVRLSMTIPRLCRRRVIHSGSWGAFAPTELDRFLSTNINDTLSRHIVGVSGISGGSYGLMHYVSAYSNAVVPIQSHHWNSTAGQFVQSGLCRSWACLPRPSTHARAVHRRWRSRNSYGTSLAQVVLFAEPATCSVPLRLGNGCKTR